MVRAVLSIGSNVGDRLAHLQSVVDALGSDVVGVSPVYQTAPWGHVPQPDFFNAIVVADGREPLGGLRWRTAWSSRRSDCATSVRVKDSRR